MNELPKMYHNKIDKNINNNERVFSTLNNDNIIYNTNNSFINNRNNLTVEQKIVNIFNYFTLCKIIFTTFLLNKKKYLFININISNSINRNIFIIHSN